MASTGGRNRWIHPLRSVRVRITLAAMLVTAAAFGMASWLLVQSVDDAPNAVLRTEVEDYLDQVVEHLAAGRDPQEALTATEEVPPVGPVVVTDEEGDVVAAHPRSVGQGDSRVVPDGGEEPDSDEDVLVAAGDVPGWDASGQQDAPGPIARTVETPDDGALTVTAVPAAERAVQSVVDRLSWSLVVGMPVLVALVGVIAWVLVGRALRPVESIRAEVERIGGATMHRRVPEPSSGDEVGRLARTMNTMLVRLEASATEQRRFVSDASHELRSPVAAIRAGLEVARRRADTDSWPALVDDLLAEESRLEALLDDLLLLAAHDENGTAPSPTARAVDLTALAVDEVRRPRRVPVHLAGSPATGHPVLVAGAEDQLTRALSNLVDNAARHAASVVQITVSNGDDTARLVVDDDGPGIPPPDRDRVFERFTRLDDGRARDEGGSGLGLAVVRSIVVAHHGRVRVEDGPLGGARFVTELPALPPL